MRPFLLLLWLLASQPALRSQPYRPHYPTYAIFASSDEDLVYYTASYYEWNEGENPADFYARLDSIQRLYAAYVLLTTLDDSDDWPVLAALQPYRRAITDGLTALRLDDDGVACAGQLIEWAAANRQRGRQPCTTGYDGLGGNNATVAAFIRAHAAQLFVDTIGQKYDPDFTGELRSAGAPPYDVLSIRHGKMWREVSYDSLGRPQQARWRYLDRDTLHETYYDNGQVTRRIQTDAAFPDAQVERTYYPDGRLFSIHRQDPRADTVSYEATFSETGVKLKEAFTAVVPGSADRRTIYISRFWNERGELEYDGRDGLTTIHYLRHGRRVSEFGAEVHGSSLYFPFRKIMPLSDELYPRLDSLTTAFISGHWPATRATVGQCRQFFQESAVPGLDSLQRAVLTPLFDALCSVYNPANNPYDSIYLPYARSARPPAPDAPARRWLEHQYDVEQLGDTIAALLLLLDNDYKFTRALDNTEKFDFGIDFYADPGPRGRLERRLNLVKRHARAEELLAVARRTLRNFPYWQREIWQKDSLFHTRLPALARTRDSLTRFWLPELRPLQQKAVKKLAKTDRELLAELRSWYRDALQLYTDEVRRWIDFETRGGAPQKRAYYDATSAIYRLYPNTLALARMRKPPYFNDIKRLTKNFQVALGDDVAAFERTEQRLIAALDEAAALYPPFGLRGLTNNYDATYRLLNWLLLE